MSSYSPTHQVRNTSPLRNATTSSYSSYEDEPAWSNEYHSNYHNEQDQSPLPPTRLTSEQSENNHSRQGRKHQRSLTELLPQFPTFKSPNSRSPTRSPIKDISHKEYEDEFMATLTGDKDNVIKVADESRGGLSSWFSGSSAPVQVGVPSDHDTQPSTPSKLFKRPTSIQFETGMRENVSPTTPDLTTMFNKFFSPVSRNRNSQHINDELLNLDISKALFPAGRSENDPFSPASFHNLLQNAEGLLSKMQAALQTRTRALSELTAEKSVKDEEYEEVQIRARSLKSQLDEMAAQIAEKERLNSELVEALAVEKNARREEAKAREKSIALVREQAMSQHSMTSEEEDLENSTQSTTVTPKKANRISYGSSSCCSEDEEVFSRTMSPRASVSTFATTSSTYSHTAEIAEASVGRVIQHPHRRPSVIRQRSTFQKVLYGDSHESNKLGMGQHKCSNCQGKDASFAWDTVGVLRAENKGLKEQVATYQEGIDGALNAVLGIGMFTN